MSQSRPEHSVFDPNDTNRTAGHTEQFVSEEQRQVSAAHIVFDAAEKQDTRTCDADPFDEELDENKLKSKPTPTGCRGFLLKCKYCFEYMIPPGGYIASAFTLGSANLGTGILALPSAFNSMGMAMALIILIIIVFFTIFSLYVMARCSDVTGMRTYPDIAKSILGYWPSVVISAFLVLYCLGIDVSYMISIGNLFTPIFDDPSVPAYLRTKSGNRLITAMVWLVLIFPICLLKSVDSLRHVSTLAVVMVMFFCVCMMVDCIKYWKVNGWRTDVHYFNTGNGAIVSLGSLLFACLVQMNAFEIYHQLNDASPRKMVLVACLGMGTCGTFYFMSGIFGYCRFGSEVNDSILLKYQPRNSPEMWVSYFGMVIKLCVGFALHQIPIRDVYYHYMGWDVYRMTWYKNCFWCAISSSVVLVAGLFIPSINIVLGLVGSLCGGFVGLIYPPIMVMYCGQWSFKKVGWVEYFAMYLLLVLGIVGCVFGTAAAIYGVV
ncbi:transmembrane amino acid transporter [Strigomonas culicis]|uniref:Transmembrane amino acid transporter n=1 Tax=Strigomonas culicis TaxID=28005 RepID=S9VHQ4_9TRYP|nr:transmembrane amino acid transporter [Strigomonas culicis]|eukprot:EPY22725.1 transmembrane amino acid transporter [Strigomonas culicis]